MANAQAANQLGLMAESPGIYAALLRRCVGMQVYPLCVHRAMPGGRTREEIDPAQEVWAADLLRLLQRPDPADVDAVFPALPGELLLAQLMADLIMAGTAYVRFQTGTGGAIVGLARLHPAVTSILYVNGARRIWYRPTAAQAQTFDGREVCVLRWISAAADARAELGIGAGECLEAISAAEVGALERTRTAIEQGGVDIAVEATDPATAALLMDPDQRLALANDLTAALGKEGQRVLIPSGGYKLNDLGLKPADLRAPETLTAARQAQLMAIGVVPVMVGADSTSYATAAAQLRVQYSWDLELAAWMEAFLLRPLAQAFARNGGGRAALSASMVTCAWDLSSHPGALAARTEAIARAVQLVDLGWTAAQAAEAEGLDLPPPEGQPRPKVPAMTPPASSSPAQGGGNPADAQGGGRTLGEWLTRSQPVTPPTPPEDPVEQQRSMLWRQKEEARTRSDADLRTAARSTLDQERTRYLTDLRAMLDAAWNGESYGSVAWGDLGAENPAVYVDGIGTPWLQTWEEAAAGAVPDDLGVPHVSSTPATLDAFQPSADAMAATTRSWTLDAARAAVEAGLPPDAALADVAQGPAFDAARDLMIARTETVRAQSEGTSARYEAAAAAGVQLEQEWLSARDSHVRDSHRALDGQRVPVGATWSIPGGPETRGPGLSGDPGEDINCRCAVSPVVVG